MAQYLRQLIVVYQVLRIRPVMIFLYDFLFAVVFAFQVCVCAGWLFVFTANVRLDDLTDSIFELVSSQALVVIILNYTIVHNQYDVLFILKIS